MRTALADTGYWLALINSDDDLRAKALEVAGQIATWRLVTTDWILLEVLNAVSARGAITRAAGAAAVRRIMSAPQVEVVKVSSADFNAALKLFEARLDKGWSLTDCASINLMHRRRIADVIAHDRHFIQAGFRALLR